MLVRGAAAIARLAGDDAVSEADTRDEPRVFAAGDELAGPVDVHLRVAAVAVEARRLDLGELVRNGHLIPGKSDRLDGHYDLVTTPAALAREQQIEQATGQITGTDRTNESLRGETAALSNQVEDISRDRDRLTK